MQSTTSKNKEFSLKKVIFLIREKYNSGLKPLCRDLIREGIETEVRNSNETDLTEMEERIVRTKKVQLKSVSDNQHSTLFICDHEAQARALQSRGYHVIIFCHPENRHENFSGFLYALEGFEELDADYFVKIWQRYEKIPWEIGKTRRCKIREMCESDLEALYELYSDPSITEYMENLYPGREQELSYIKDYIEKIYSYYGFGTWLITEQTTGQLIGRAGFNYRPGFEEPELGFVIGVPWQKQGYAYEVCCYLIDFVQKVYEWKCIQALTSPHNTASIALLKKLGFHLQGPVEIEGQMYDRYLWNV